MKNPHAHECCRQRNASGTTATYVSAEHASKDVSQAAGNLSGKQRGRIKIPALNICISRRQRSCNAEWMMTWMHHADARTDHERRLTNCTDNLG